MKTPVQELYERLWEAEKDKFVWAAILKDVLQKEKDEDVMKQSFVESDWYKELSKYRFNTKE